MCGIVGFHSKNVYNKSLIENMLLLIKFRGPDYTGIWQNEDNNIVFGHNRLSILDTSDAGIQPMISHNGRYIIVLNGEIYNYIELKNEVEKTNNINWRGGSDTEILLELINLYGIQKCLEKLSGMFAFALYDNLKNTLTLARDRAGEKPLYFYKNNSSFVFSSDLRSIESFPEFNESLNYDAISYFLKHKCVSDKSCIYNNTYKVEPGTYLTYKIDDQSIIKNKFWSLNDEVGEFYYNYTENELIDILDEKLNNSVKKMMRSDVPYGAFLSGGVDSSLIVSIMQNNSEKKVNTFSIGFEDIDYDESTYAKQVSDHLGTNHTNLIINYDDLKNVIPKICNIYDEPYADSSLIPTYLVSQLAKKDVSVALSGDAGDELFYGYNRYIFSSKIIQNTKYFNFLFSKINKLLKYDKFNSIINYNNKSNLYKINNFLSANNIYNKYNILLSNYEGYSLLMDYKENIIQTNKSTVLFNRKDVFSIFDFNDYLNEDILVKVDRAAMFNSLETRVPFLDKDIIHFAYNIPFTMKYQNKTSKYIVKRVLEKYIPKKLIYRKKKGFSIPLNNWMKNDLKNEINDLLSTENIKKQNIFDYKIINKIKDGFYLKNYSNENILWNLFCFQLWFNK